MNSDKKIGIIGIIVGILGIGVGIFLYFISIKEVVPVYSINSNTLIFDSNFDSNIDFKYNKQDIFDLWKAEITFFNKGKKYFKTDDIINGKLTVNSSENISILNANISKQSRENLFHLKANNKNKVDLYLNDNRSVENKEGCIIEILYTGGPATFSIVGEITGAAKKGINLISDTSSLTDIKIRKDYVLKYLYLILAIFILVIGRRITGFGPLFEFKIINKMKQKMIIKNKYIQVVVMGITLLFTTALLIYFFISFIPKDTIDIYLSSMISSWKI